MASDPLRGYPSGEGLSALDELTLTHPTLGDGVVFHIVDVLAGCEPCTLVRFLGEWRKAAHRGDVPTLTSMHLLRGVGMALITGAIDEFGGLLRVVR